MPRRRCVAATISPRSATSGWRCAGRGRSRAGRPPRRRRRRRRRRHRAGERAQVAALSPTLRQPSVLSSQASGSRPIEAPSSTSAAAFLRARRADLDRHPTTMPWPPRRGLAGRGERAVGAALDGRDTAEVEIAASPAHAVPALGQLHQPALEVEHVPGDAGGPVDRPATGCRAGPRRRPGRSPRRAEPSRRLSARRGRPSLSTSVGVIMLGSRSPGAFGAWPTTSSSPSMLFSWVPPRKIPSRRRGSRRGRRRCPPRRARRCGSSLRPRAAAPRSRGGARARSSSVSASASCASAAATTAPPRRARASPGSSTVPIRARSGSGTATR